MKQKLRDNGLTLAVFALFFLFLCGEALSGWHDYNFDQRVHHQATVSLPAFLTTGHFIETTLENWESEFLEMAGYVVLTSFLFQRGSAESKDPDNPDKEQSVSVTSESPGPVKRGGWLLAVYRRSLSIALFVLFSLSFLGHAIAGWQDFNEQLQQEGQATLSLWGFATSSHFWFQSFQNWQSEFLGVGTIVLLSIWLRQDGSPQSKPIAAPHSQTGD